MFSFTAIGVLLFATSYTELGWGRPIDYLELGWESGGAGRETTEHGSVSNSLLRGVNATSDGTSASNATSGNATKPTATGTSPAVSVSPPTANATSPADSVTPPTTNATIPTTVATSPAVSVTSPTPNVSIPIENVTPPSSNVTSPAVSVTPPTANVTAPDVSVTPPAVTVKPPTVNVTPPAISETAPATTVKPPAVDVTSPTPIVTPSPVSVKPPAATVKPPATTVKPPATTVRPPATTVKPPPATVKPPATTVKPPAATVKPPVATVKPPATTVKPPTVTPKPIGNCTLGEDIIHVLLNKTTTMSGGFVLENSVGLAGSTDEILEKLADKFGTHTREQILACLQLYGLVGERPPGKPDSSAASNIGYHRPSGLGGVANPPPLPNVKPPDNFVYGWGYTTYQRPLNIALRVPSYRPASPLLKATTNAQLLGLLWSDFRSSWDQYWKQGTPAYWFDRNAKSR